MLTDQLSTGVEADPVAVEQFVHMGGVQQAVGAIEPLAFVAVAPGFDMARYQKLLPCQALGTAGRFLFSYPVAKQPLPQPRLGERIALRAAGHFLQALHVVEQAGGVLPDYPLPVLVLIGLWRSGRSGCQFTRTSQPSRLQLSSDALTTVEVFIAHVAGTVSSLSVGLFVVDPPAGGRGWGLVLALL